MELQRKSSGVQNCNDDLWAYLLVPSKPAQRRAYLLDETFGIVNKTKTNTSIL